MNAILFGRYNSLSGGYINCHCWLKIYNLDSNATYIESVKRHIPVTKVTCQNWLLRLEQPSGQHVVHLMLEFRKQFHKFFFLTISLVFYLKVLTIFIKTLLIFYYQCDTVYFRHTFANSFTQTTKKKKKIQQIVKYKINIDFFHFITVK